MVVFILIKLSSSGSLTFLFLLQGEGGLMLGRGVDIQVIIALDLTISNLTKSVKNIWLCQQFFKLVVSLFNFCLIQNYIGLRYLKLLIFFNLVYLAYLRMSLVKLSIEKCRLTGRAIPIDGTFLTHLSGLSNRYLLIK